MCRISQVHSRISPGGQHLSAQRSFLSHKIRWATAAVAVGMVGAGIASSVLTEPAGASVSPGVGSSYAQGFQVTPHEGSLAVGGVFDEALAGHTDQIARAQSQGLDLGAVGTSIKGYNCGQPPSAAAAYVPDPLQAETPSNGGKDTSTAGPQSNNSDGSTEYVLANGSPYGEADTVFGGVIAAPSNLISISHVASKAWSGIVNGDRVAAATTDIGQVSIAGTVTLSGLHWEATFPSGASAKPTSTFDINKVTVAGQSLPTGDLSAVADAVNQALGKLGIELVFPSSTNAQGIQFESPLQVEVVPNSTRDGITDPVITGVVGTNEYPIASGLENGFANTSAPYNALAPTEQGAPGSPQQQLEAALCQSDTPITVADITIAAFTAGGYFNLGLGGVNATSGALPSNPYSLNAFAPFSLPGSTQVIPGTPGTPAVAGAIGTANALPAASIGSSPAAAPSVAPSSSGTPASAPASISPAASVAHAASGPLLGVGLGVLGLLGLLAELDRRSIRRTVRSAVFEE